MRKCAELFYPVVIHERVLLMAEFTILLLKYIVIIIFIQLEMIVNHYWSVL